MSYRKQEIWQLAQMLTVDVHQMTLKSLPKFEIFDEGTQIRRSMKSVRSNIVEGYGRRHYKQDSIRFLTYALASCDETTDHLEILKETGSLQDQQHYIQLHDGLQILGKKHNLFLQSIEKSHQSVREESSEYIINSFRVTSTQQLETRHQ